jgi:putative sigma-54 modulation protein
MKISVIGRHIQVTDDVRDYIEKRARKIEGIFSSIVDLQATIEQEKNRYSAEMTLTTRRAVFHAQRETYDIFTSVDNVMDRIETQIRRHKEKVKDVRHRQPQRDIAIQLNEANEPASAEAADRDLPQIVRVTDKFADKPITAEEAAMQLETSGDTVLLFVNSETNQVNLLYQMDGGAFGWVEPQ